VFDSRLTTYAHLTRLERAGITFITLRRQSAALLAEIEGLAPSAWRRVTLEVPARKYNTPGIAFTQQLTAHTPRLARIVRAMEHPSAKTATRSARLRRKIFIDLLQ